MVERFPVTLGSDGVLSLVFAATVNLATVSGIEVGCPPRCCLLKKVLTMLQAAAGMLLHGDAAPCVGHMHAICPLSSTDARHTNTCMAW